MAVSKAFVLFKKVISFPNDLMFFLCGEGSWKLRDPVDQILAHFLSTLPAAEADMIRRQLAQSHTYRCFLQGRTTAMAFHALDPDTLLTDQVFQEGVFVVEMRVDGKKQRANVSFFKGRIEAIQIRQPIKFYRGKTITFGAVKLGKSSQSLARAWDRQEHGRGEDI